MKTIVTFMAVCCLATACNFSAGTQKDFITGLSVTNNGLSFGDAMLVNDENKKAKNNEVELNKTIAVVVDDIQHYEEKDGRVFPGLDLTVVDKNGTVVLEGTDILKNDEGYTPQDGSVLRGTITVGNPMQAGETYHAKMRIWDKLKPESEIVVNVDLVVK